MELSKIEYTLNYLNNNQHDSGKTGFYRRHIPERTIIVREYTGSLTDVRKIEMASGELYNYAQSKIFFEVVRKDIRDKSVVTVPVGDFQYCQVDLKPEINIQQLIAKTYGKEKKVTLLFPICYLKNIR